MSSIYYANSVRPYSCLLYVYSRLRAFVEDVHEYFTHHKATIEKINTLSKRVFAAEQNFSQPGKLNQAMFELKDLLEENAYLQIKKIVYHPKIRQVYEKFSQDLKRLQGYATPERINDWLNTEPADQKTDVNTTEKVTVSRWVKATPAQCRFAAHYNLKEVPFKFSEIPAGSVLLTDPYAYLKHMQLEGKTSFFPCKGKNSILKTIIIKLKAILSRFLTGKQFTHVGYSLGNGQIFDLEKKTTGWMQGEGKIVDHGDKIFYGVVMAPDKYRMLKAYNDHFPQSLCGTFDELMHKIKAEVQEATSNNRVQLNAFDIAKTLFVQKRSAKYDPTQAWKSGACRYSCSGTTSSLLSKFGLDVGAQFKKMDINVTPTDFYHSHYFHQENFIP